MHTKPKSLFISYTRDDYDYAKAFYGQLHLFRHQHADSVFLDSERVQVGEKWYPKIEQALARTQAFIVLLSANYFNSSFCFDEELPRICRRYQQDNAEIFFVQVSAFNWSQYKINGFRLQAIQALGPYDHNRRLVDIKGLSDAQQSKAYAAMVSEIYRHFGLGDQSTEVQTLKANAARRSQNKPIDADACIAFIDKKHNVKRAKVVVDGLENDASTVVPLVTRGHAKDWHEGLAIRLHFLEDLADLPAHLQIPKIEWPASGRYEGRKKGLWTELARQMGIAHKPEGKAMELDRLLSHIRNALRTLDSFVVRYEIGCREWSGRDDNRLLRECLEGWEGMDAGACRIFLLFALVKPERSWLRPFKGKSLASADLCRAVDQLHDVSELVPVDRKEDLVDWLEHLKRRDVLTEPLRQDLKTYAEEHMRKSRTMAHGDLRGKLSRDARFLEIMGLN